MDYLRITGGLLLICCGTMTGLSVAGRFRRRVELMEQYRKFLTQAETIIRYTPVTLEELLGMIRCGELLHPVIQKTKELLQSGQPPEVVWRKAVGQFVPVAEDRRLLYEFGDYFGTGDLNGELQKLALHRQFAQQRYEELQSELHIRRKLYRIVGMFGGVVAAVLLI